ncbi:MAG: hypothetical protein AVDCRST_MAG30-3873, partial [uncultured Solirubrobacteraceae bacterium]
QPAQGVQGGQADLQGGPRALRGRPLRAQPVRHRQGRGPARWRGPQGHQPGRTGPRDAGLLAGREEPQLRM